MICVFTKEFTRDRTYKRYGNLLDTFVSRRHEHNVIEEETIRNNSSAVYKKCRNHFGHLLYILNFNRDTIVSIYQAELQYVILVENKRDDLPQIMNDLKRIIRSLNIYCILRCFKPFCEFELYFLSESTPLPAELKGRLNNLWNSLRADRKNFAVKIISYIITVTILLVIYYNQGTVGIAPGSDLNLVLPTKLVDLFLLFIITGSYGIIYVVIRGIALTTSRIEIERR